MQLATVLACACASGSKGSRPCSVRQRAAVLETMPHLSPVAGALMLPRPLAQHRDKRTKTGFVHNPMDEGLLRKCDGMLKGIMKRTQAVHFSKPVDWKKMGLHEYPRLIKQPMDLGTVQERLTRHHYTRLEDMAHDCRLVWVCSNQIMRPGRTRALPAYKPLPHMGGLQRPPWRRSLARSLGVSLRGLSHRLTYPVYPNIRGASSVANGRKTPSCLTARSPSTSRLLKDLAMSSRRSLRSLSVRPNRSTTRNSTPWSAAGYYSTT